MLLPLLPLAAAAAEGGGTVESGGEGGRGMILILRLGANQGLAKTRGPESNQPNGAKFPFGLARPCC